MNQKKSKSDESSLKWEKLASLQSKQSLNEYEDQQDARKIKKGS